MSFLFTIFTPTYNRCDTLSRLYDSLVHQTNKDFEWLIVDDGSTDDTSSLVSGWIQDRLINIRYFKQDNGGKHRAINRGLDLAKGELFFIVDSDDYLPCDSLSIAEEYYLPVKDNNNIIGVVGFCSFPNGNITGSKLFPKEIVDANIIERRNLYKIKADLAKVIKTHLFKKFYFPDIPSEKFVAESIVWNKMAIDYDFRYFNKSIYFCEYLEGGLSNNSIRNRRNNSIYSTKLYAELFANPKSNFKLKLKSSINFWRFAFCRKESVLELSKELNNVLFTILSLPIGLGFYMKDNYRNKIDIKIINNER